jgi:hypothetical protein
MICCKSSKYLAQEWFKVLSGSTITRVPFDTVLQAVRYIVLIITAN